MSSACLSLSLPDSSKTMIKKTLALQWEWNADFHSFLLYTVHSIGTVSWRRQQRNNNTVFCNKKVKTCKTFAAMQSSVIPQVLHWPMKYMCKYVQGWLLWDSRWNDCCCELLQSFLTVLQTSILFYCLFLASDKPLLRLLANALTPGSIPYSQTRKLLTMYRGFNPKSSTPSTSTEKTEGED